LVLFSAFEKLHKAAVSENCCPKTIATKVNWWFLCGLIEIDLSKIAVFPLPLFFFCVMILHVNKTE